MKRITVTGASGFIGTRLVKRLVANGHEVSALIRRNRSADPFGPDLRVIHGDVAHADSLSGCFKNCDTVIHLAGCTIARSNDEFDRVNRVGTENVAKECASQTSPPKLLFVSSLAAAGPAPGGRPLVEQDQARPASDYGRSKLAAELHLQQISDQLPIQIVRPPAVFGDTDVHMLALFKYAKAGWVFLPGGSTARYSLIHVDDLVQAIIHVCGLDHVRICKPRHEPAGTDAHRCDHQGVVYLSQPTALSFPEVAAIASEAVGRGNVRRFHVPSPCCWTLAATNSLIARTVRMRPLLNRDKMREAMAGDWMCDSSRLTDELGFKFQVSLEQRIQQTAQSYQEKGWI